MSPHLSPDPHVRSTARRIPDAHVRRDVAVRWPPAAGMGSAPALEDTRMTTEPTKPKATPETTKPKVTPARVKTSEAASPPDTIRADRVEISQGGAERVEATSVSIMQGGVGTAVATTVDVRQGGIGQASATDIALSQGAIGFARGERVSLEMGAIGAAVGDDVRVTQAMANIVAARGDVTVDQSLVSTLIGYRVTIRQPSAVLLIIAGKVDGSVRPLLDWRGGLAAGAAAGLVIGLLRAGRR